MTQTKTPLRILVTGGSGFIGSQTVARLNALGHTDITIVDRLGKTDKWRNLVGLRYVEYIETDVFSQRLADARAFGATTGWDIIIHLGACSSTREQDMGYLARNNVAFGIEIMRLVMESGARFVYASSAATYGLGDTDDSQHPDDLRPINPYGLSKNMFDQYAARTGWAERIAGLKYTNVFGANSEHKGIMRSFVATVYDQIKDKGRVSLYDVERYAPNGLCARDFLYVDDAVDVTLHFALGAGRSAHGLFNVGSGTASTWNEVVDETYRALGREPLIDITPMPDALKGKYQYYTKADVSKLRATGYDKPFTSLRDGVRTYVQDYLVLDLRVGERLVTPGARPLVTLMGTPGWNALDMTRPL